MDAWALSALDVHHVILNLKAPPFPFQRCKQTRGTAQVRNGFFVQPGGGRGMVCEEPNSGFAFAKSAFVCGLVAPL